MQFSEFIQAYDRNVHMPRQGTHDEHPEIIAGRQYSGDFGATLHDRLSGSDSRAFGTMCLKFVPWFDSTYARLFDDLKEKTDFSNPESADQYFRVGNEFNWHGLSYAMMPSWDLLDRAPATKPHLSEADIIVEQASLAVAALDFYIERNKGCSIQQDYIYFSDANSQKRMAFEGVITEIETAIVLLEIQKKHPGLIIVPAPLQFEHTITHGKNINADFLAINAPENQVVGIQAKNTVRSTDRDEYDGERIVLVDGRIDFGNEKLNRTIPGRSNTRMTPWPGLISVHFLKALPTNGPSVSALEQHFYKPDLIKYKTHARTLAGTSTNNLRVAARRIVDRLEPHIQISTLKNDAPKPIRTKQFAKR